MSLGIAFKGPEGIVLAADSRVTINAERPINDNLRLLLPSTFDNATKLLKIIILIIPIYIISNFTLMFF